MRRHVVVAVTLACTLLAVSACAPAPSPSERTRLQEEARQFNSTRADISFLDGPDAEGRQTASRGYTRTATFLSEQLRIQGLQPILSGEYRTQYAAELRRVIQDRAAVRGRDTTILVRGTDYMLMDVMESVTTRGTNMRPDIPGVIWREDLVLEGDSLDIDFRVDTRATTAPMHVLGLIPGADPRQRDSLVVWIAPSDAQGMQGGESWTDGSDLAIPAAALLAASRGTAALQQSWASYPQSILVAFVSGTRESCQGPRMLARHFPWDKSLVSRVIVVEMTSSEECDWEAVLEDMDTPIQVLGAYQPFASPAEYGFGVFRPRSETQRPEALDVATTEALRLSREFVRRLP